MVSPIKLNIEENWNYRKIDSWHIYTHPDCIASFLEDAGKVFILIGHIIDPDNPDFSNEDVLRGMSNSVNLVDVKNHLYRMSGNFVLLVKIKGEYFVFNDACGLKTVYYQDSKEGTFLCSQPLLIEKYLGAEKSENATDFLESDYVKKNKEFWVPCGVTLFKNIYQLLPNHHLHLNGLRQKRFFPIKKLERLELEEGVEKFTEEFQKILKAMDNRYSLALPLTAGWDSRIILSACKPYYKKMEFFTLKYRDLSSESNDIKIPRILLDKINRNHEIIDTDLKTDENFKKLYKSNVHLPHFNDWGIIAYGMFKSQISNRVSLKGSCSEVARCFYYPDGVTADNFGISDIMAYTLYDWSGFTFFENHLNNWLRDIENAKELDYKLEDFFYWEHRVGSWQAQSQLEWELVQEAISPFNNRKLLNIALGVPSKYRCSPNYVFFERVIDKLWPELLEVPINPISNKTKLIRYLLSKTKIGTVRKQILKRIK